MKKNIKSSWISIIICMMLVISLLPATAFAFDEGEEKYDDYEYNKLEAFLSHPSASSGYTNGQTLTSMYDEDSPSSWPGVTWAPYTEDSGTVLHVTEISWTAYDLDGDLDLSDFKYLELFDANYNHIDSLEINNDTALETLNCSGTHLVDINGNVKNVGITSLDLGTNTALQSLNCSENALTALDVSANTNLTSLNCNNNEISALNLSGHTLLEELKCGNNKITSLDTSAAGANLQYLQCGSNEISTLGISTNSGLVEFYCENNKLTGTLDLENRASLDILDCGVNELTSLVTKGCTNLTILSCIDNQISSLDIAKCAVLDKLFCSGNSLSALDVSTNKTLTELTCAENQLASLSVSANTKLRSLYCNSNKLGSLDVSANIDLLQLGCSDNNLSDLNVNANINLNYLDCSKNKMTGLDVSRNTALVELGCEDNLLTTLDVGNNTSLRDLECSGNRLGTLDVTKNTSLQSLDCASAGLSALDVTNNVSLVGLDCSDNQLGTLDLSHNTILSTLDCSGNQFKSLDISGFILMLIDCTDNPLTYLKAAITYDWVNTYPVELNANGEGYVGLYFNWFGESGDNMYFEAVPKTDGMFLSWTDAANATVSTSAKYAYKYNTAYILTANFPYVVSFDTDGGSTVAKQSVPPGGRVSKPADPVKTGYTFGGWYKQREQTSAWIFGVDTVTANTTLYAKWVKPTDTHTLIPVSISCTKTDASLYGAANGNITITAAGGNSGAYLYSIDGGETWSNTNSFSVAAGTYTAAACDAANKGNGQTQTVTIGQPPSRGNVPAAKVPSKVNAGTAVTMIPPAAPKGYTTQSVSYSSSNPAVASVDSVGNVTFLAGGKVTIITKVVSQTVDKKGRVKTKTTTVKKTVTVQQPVSSISLNLADTTIARTQKVKLTASVTPGTASNKKLTWKSSNSKVAAVSSAGVVTGKAGGTAVISCTAKDGSGVTASCTVTVTPIYPAGLKLSKAALTLKTGKTAALKATIAPKNTDFKTVTWASSNPAVATVDAKGKVKAIAPGTATITATTSNGIAAVCTVTVQ